MTPDQVSSIPAAGALHCQTLQVHDTSFMRHQQLVKPILLSPPRHRHHRLQPGCLLSGSVKALCVAPNTPECFTTYHHHLHKSHALVKLPCCTPYYVSSSPACREDPHWLGCDRKVQRPQCISCNRGTISPCQSRSIRDVCLASSLAIASGSCVISPLRRSISS